MASDEAPTRRSLDSLERIVDRRPNPNDRRWHEGHAERPVRRANGGPAVPVPRERKTPG